jgi:hypothetical protein
MLLALFINSLFERTQVPASFVAIDRAKPQHKFNKYHPCCTFQRITIDIEVLDFFSPTERHIISHST